MEYIWETLGPDQAGFFFEQAEVFGPYSEVVQVKNDTQISEKRIVEYNSLFRFDEIFADMLMLKEQEEEWVKYFMDACTHLLIQIEGLEGLNKRELYIRRLMHRIQSGKCLASIREDFLKVSSAKQYEIASYFIKQEEIGESVFLYAKAVTDILEMGTVYKNSVLPDELLVYLGKKLTDEQAEIWKILNQCFLPLAYKVRLFENTHFAVLDEEQTLQYERLELF